MSYVVRLTHYTLDRALELLRRRADQGMLDGAAIIRDRARDNLEAHRYQGTAAAATQVGPLVQGDEQDTVAVGVLDMSQAPHARALEYNWASSAGLQPPIEPIAQWALDKGIVSDEREARSFGFAVARKIAANGFSMGPLHWLGDAASASAPEVGAAIVHAAQEH